MSLNTNNNSSKRAKKGKWIKGIRIGDARWQWCRMKNTKTLKEHFFAHSKSGMYCITQRRMNGATMTQQRNGAEREMENTQPITGWLAANNKAMQQFNIIKTKRKEQYFRIPRIWCCFSCCFLWFSTLLCRHMFNERSQHVLLSLDEDADTKYTASRYYFHCERRNISSFLLCSSHSSPFSIWFLDENNNKIHLELITRQKGWKSLKNQTKPEWSDQRWSAMFRFLRI